MSHFTIFGNFRQFLAILDNVWYFFCNVLSNLGFWLFWGGFESSTMKKVPPGQLGKNILEPINILSEEGVEHPNYQIVPL